ncbi:MAG: efflux RND transporter periplasmic adaptor subunit [Polaribacter sp.]|nr:efflux RND transporter periplasmic adaptor subunit [Polaribacter sp.]MDG1953304.1 efflux RND transporter periplasmic adaptor subunit [Polaribacter sp.]MDG2073302.1 efflux RND transporter periplasmic adaptor subunit [Polaribacter sp.]
MKTIYTLVFASLLFISCGEKKVETIEEVIATNDIVKIKAKKAEIETKQQGFNDQLKMLNTKLDALDTNKKIPLITTFKVKEVVFTHFLELQGNVETKQNILIYPEMPGILATVIVKEGQAVKKGDVLATIKDGGLSQQLSQLETQTELTRTTFERQKRLWNQKIGSEMQYLQAKAQYEAQKKSVEQLKTQIEKATILAPFDGVIDEVFKEPGTVIAPGQGSEIFRIVNLSNMYISTEVPERFIASVTKNKNVKIAFPVLGLNISSTIRQVASFINPNNRSFKIEVPVANKNGNIKPNLTARLQINDYTNNNAILIPQSIISENANGEQFIYVVKNKNKNKEAIAQRVIIKTGKTQGDVIEVLANLPAGTEVILEGARSVNNGQTVRVINK